MNKSQLHKYLMLYCYMHMHCKETVFFSLSLSEIGQMTKSCNQLYVDIENKHIIKYPITNTSLTYYIPELQTLTWTIPSVSNPDPNENTIVSISDLTPPSHTPSFILNPKLPFDEISQTKMSSLSKNILTLKVYNSNRCLQSTHTNTHRAALEIVDQEK